MNLSDVGAPVEGDLLYELRYVVLKCIFAERMDNPDAAGIDMGKFPGMQAVPICRRDFNFIRSILVLLMSSLSLLDFC